MNTPAKAMLAIALMDSPSQAKQSKQFEPKSYDVLCAKSYSIVAAWRQTDAASTENPIWPATRNTEAQLPRSHRHVAGDLVRRTGRA
jgi:hypothetical protein